MKVQGLIGLGIAREARSMRAAAFLLLVGIMISACQTGRIDVYGCLEPCYDCEDPCTPCPHGECVPLPPLGWDGPVLLWSGKPDEMQGCPERASNVVYEGYDGLSYTPACPTCSCGPSACVLPVLEASPSAMCQTAGQIYAGPDDWTGACISPGTIPDAEVDSVLFPQLTLAPCEAHTGEIPHDYQWATLAMACQTTEPTTACDATTICVPTSEPPPPGFEQCIYRDGEHTCPFGYPTRHVFFSTIDTSAAGCSPCECGPPVGGACEVRVDLYEQAGCTGGTLWAQSSTSTPYCLEWSAGFDLASMTATWLQDTPGTCTPSGGEPFGQATPAQPATFCCQTKPAPEP